MTRLLRRSIPFALVLVALGCLSATANGAGGIKKASVGDYQASPAITGTENYSVGLFSVSKTGGKRQIVRTDGYLGIYYPDVNECDDYDVPLAAESIPIASTGKFKINEKTPVEDDTVRVIWSGRWTKAGVVSGTITIKHAGCTSTRKWSGGKVVAQS